MFCPCGWNKETGYSNHKSFFAKDICPECGRSFFRCAISKGRWKKGWDGNKWDLKDWEDWVDPDPKPPSLIKRIWDHLKFVFKINEADWYQ